MAYRPKYTVPLTPSILHELLIYEPDTGAMFWRPRSRARFTTDVSFKAWNTDNAGKPAFTALCKNGYRSGAIFGKVYRGHRIAMAMHLGRMLTDKEFIDHINGNRGDNRAENMRLVDRKQNMRNAKRPSDNTSGVIGVSRFKGCKGKPWRARIHQKDIGIFATFEEAVAARKAAEIEYGYHKNHGRH